MPSGSPPYLIARGTAPYSNLHCVESEKPCDRTSSPSRECTIASFLSGDSPCFSSRSPAIRNSSSCVSGESMSSAHFLFSSSVVTLGTHFAVSSDTSVWPEQ